MDEYNPTPNPITRTAVPGNYINITMSYLPPSGVFIVDNYGELFTLSDWSGGSNCTGVALITDNVKIITAIDLWKSGSQSGTWGNSNSPVWGGYAWVLTDIMTTTSSTEAITDFNGSSNTDQIITQCARNSNSVTDSMGHTTTWTGAPAAGWCRDYSKGCKGVGEWYLPAAGEMNIIVTNKDAINTALNIISGETLDNWTHTSTQYDSGYVWCYNWYNEGFYNGTKIVGYRVRPVCTF